MALDAEVNTFTGDGVTTGADNVPFTNGSLAAKLFLPYGNGKTAGSDNLRMCIGAATAAGEEGAVLACSQDNQSTTRAGMATENANTYRIRSDNPATSNQVLFDTTALNTGSVDINITSAAFTQRFQFLALGGSDVDPEVVNFVLNTSTGNQDVNLARLTGSTVKGLLLFATPATAAGFTQTGAAGFSAGMTDGTTQACMVFFDQHGQGDSDTYSAHRTDCVLSILDGVGAVVAEATIVSLGTGTFRINVTTASPAVLVTAVAFCGSIGCQVKNFSQPATAQTQALGFTNTPGVLIAMSGGKAAGAASAELKSCFGAAASISQLSCVAGSSQDAQGVSNCGVYTSTAKLVAFCGNTGPMLAEADLNDMQTLNWTTSDGVSRDFSLLAISAAAGGSLTTVSQTDGLFMLDRSARVVQRSAVDFALLGDLASRLLQRPSIDSLLVGDGSALHTVRTSADGLFLFDWAQRVVQRSAIDDILFSDNVQRVIQRSGLDVVLLDDYALRQILITARDNLLLDDSSSSTSVTSGGAALHIVAIVDTLLLNDAISRTIERQSLDNLPLSDAAYRHLERRAQDLLEIYDGIARQIHRLGLDTLLLGDEGRVQAIRQVAQTDNLLLQDTVNRMIERVALDVVLLNDYVARFIHRVARDQLLLYEEVTTSLIQASAEALTWARIVIEGVFDARVSVDDLLYVTATVRDMMGATVEIEESSNLD